MSKSKNKSAKSTRLGSFVARVLIDNEHRFFLNDERVEELPNGWDPLARSGREQVISNQNEFCAYHGIPDDFNDDIYIVRVEGEVFLGLNGDVRYVIQEVESELRDLHNQYADDECVFVVPSNKPIDLGDGY